MSNLPAVPDPEPAREVELARTDLDSWVQVMRPVIALAEHIAHTEFVPKSLRNVPATTAAILYGREVGLPPMTSLTQTHVIEGKPSMSAEAMRAMVLSQGHELEFLETTGSVCTMRARRRNSQTWTELSWTTDMARAAGLTGKNNWKNYPRAMLIARCTGDLCRMIFPDVILGFRSVEEMEDLGASEGEAPALPAGGDTGTTQVARKPRATRKKPAPAPDVPAPAPLAVAGPPLPGEDGYDGDERTEGGARPAEPTSTGTDDGPTPNHGEGTGNDTEAPADVDGSRGAATEAGPVKAGGEATETGPADGDEQARVEKDPPPKPITRPQLRMIFASLGERGVDPADDEERKQVVGTLVSREIESFNDLTTADANHIIDTLARVPDKAALYALLDELDKAAGR